VVIQIFDAGCVVLLRLMVVGVMLVAAAL